MSIRKVTCLKCIFLRANFEDDMKVYRCQANDLKKIDISNPILCSKYRGKRKKIIKKDFKLKNIKNNIENYFDTEQLYKNMLEKQENK